MKFFIRSFAAFAALALAHSASATTNVYITGSTAFRTAIMTLLSGTAIFDSTPQEAYAGSSASGATYANFTGTVNSQAVRVKCSWTGSAGGIYLVAHSADATPAEAVYLLDSSQAGGLADNVGGQANPDPTNPLTLHTVDMAMSDAFQSSSLFLSPSVIDTPIGIVTFKWVGNYSLDQNAAGGTQITNITSQNVKSLYSGGYLISASFLTGSASTTDQQIYCFAMGRDFDSGTRIGAFADSGTGATTSPKQWQPFMTPTTGGFVGTPYSSDTAAQTDTTITELQQWNATPSLTGVTLTNGSKTITWTGVTPSTSQIKNGYRISGTGIPTGTRTLSSVSENTDGSGSAQLSIAANANVSAGTAAISNSVGLGIGYQLYNHVLTVGNNDGGFNGGGNLAKVMRSDTNTNIPAWYNGHLKTVTGYSQNCAGAYFITYLGISDAATALNPTVSGNYGLGKGRELTYNGVAYSTNAIEQGQYTYWGYEHLDTKTTLTGSANDVYTRLFNALTNDSTDLSAVGFHLDAMLVGRTTDGSAISANYY